MKSSTIQNASFRGKELLQGENQGKEIHDDVIDVVAVPVLREKKLKLHAGQIQHIFTLLTAVLIPLLIGAFSAFLTAGDMNIYKTANRPFLAPPGWVFPIAWTLLYTMMGVASYFIYTSDARPKLKRTALQFYAAQLIMNFFWSTLFFTYGQYLISFIWLLAMWVLILLCGIRFYRIHKTAGLLMGGLFLWTTFAAYLNFAWYILSITPAAIPA